MVTPPTPTATSFIASLRLSSSPKVAIMQCSSMIEALAKHQQELLAKDDDAQEKDED